MSNKTGAIPRDLLVEAAARALAAGDPLTALNRVALREDAPALALRGIAMAQMGDLVRARDLLRRAVRAFGPAEAVARARCVVAEHEIALASRDLAWPARTLDAARATLEEFGDRANAAHARLLDIRRLVLIGRVGDAEQALGALDPESLPPPHRAACELVIAGIAMRRIRTKPARAALAHAKRAARQAGIPSLLAEVESAARILNAPAARLVGRLLRLEDVEALLASGAVVVDACRYGVRDAHTSVSLARRPVLFSLARALGEAWPDDATRDTLIARAFEVAPDLADETDRARLRVEMGRLRMALRPLVSLNATKRGFVMSAHAGGDVVVLDRPIDEEHAVVLACLADGESWSSSALALVLGASQRAVQRQLELLAAAGKVQSFGRGPACRWITPPVPGFAPILLLSTPLPAG